ncbi:MAG: hypothetical protein ABI615_07095, partial [Chthoniobacterales bacterium]
MNSSKSLISSNTIRVIPVLMLGLLLAVTETQAATYTFDTAVTGAQSWTTTSNWTPNTGSPSLTTDLGIIDRSASSGDVSITTPGTATTIRQLTLTAGASSALTLKLGNNLSLTNASFAQSIFTNNIDASKMVFDLNSYTFTTDGAGAGPFVRNAAPGLKYFTVKDTSTGGAGTITFGLYSQSSGSVSIENNATLRVTSAAGLGPVTTAYTSFSSGSTLQIDVNNATTTTFTSSLAGGINSALGNLTIGSTVNSNKTALYFYGSTQRLVVSGNFFIGQGSNIILGQRAGDGITSVSVGGNFTDLGSAVTTYQGPGLNSTISLNGGSVTEHTLSINRTLNANSGTVTNFEIGDGTTAGNIKLVNASSTVGALYTAGSMTVRNGSILNLGTSTTTGDVASLRAGSIIVGTGATIGVTFGAHSGYAVADATLGGAGTLTLNTFNLELNYSGSGWVDGSDLLLFHYTGTLTGTPTLGTVTVSGYTYGGLFNDGNNIYLTGLTAVPIP